MDILPIRSMSDFDIMLTELIEVAYIADMTESPKLDAFDLFARLFLSMIDMKTFKTEAAAYASSVNSDSIEFLDTLNGLHHLLRDADTIYPELY